MSIRRRINTRIVDIWVTNNSNDVNVVGSLRWAMVQASNTLPTFIKVSPDFIDLAGVGRNMYVADTVVSNIFQKNWKDITIDFSYINVIFGAGGGLSGPNGNTSFNIQNMVVENQDFGTTTTVICSQNMNLTNCRFENLVKNNNVSYFSFIVSSAITNCIFRNVVNNYSNKSVLSFTSGTFTIDSCIFDNTVGLYGVNSSAITNISRCYISVNSTFVRYPGLSPTFNFSHCYIQNSGTSTSFGLVYTNYGYFTNCTFFNIRIMQLSGYGEIASNIRHCTQLYTLPIGATTVLNPISTTLAHTIQNNIFISPNSNNIFATNLTNLTESGNLYLCKNANTLFPNSTHYPANTPLSTLIDTNQQGLGETFKRYYLPSITNNVTRLGDVLLNQIEQNRNELTNSGAI